MNFDHNKYPIIVGATYINNENQKGILESCELFPTKNNAKIIIDMQNKGMFYKLNYDTFCMYWKLLN